MKKLIYEFLSEGKEASVAEINKEAIERGGGAHRASSKKFYER